ARTDVGAAVRSGQDRFRVQASLAVAPVKAVVTEVLRAAVGKVNGSAAGGSGGAVAGRGNDIQHAVGCGRRQGKGARLDGTQLHHVVGIGRLELVPGSAAGSTHEGVTRG